MEKCLGKVFLAVIFIVFLGLKWREGRKRWEFFFQLLHKFTYCFHSIGLINLCNQTFFIILNIKFRKLNFFPSQTTFTVCVVARHNLWSIWILSGYLLLVSWWCFLPLKPFSRIFILLFLFKILFIYCYIFICMITFNLFPLSVSLFLILSNNLVIA